MSSIVKTKVENPTCLFKWLAIILKGFFFFLLKHELQLGNAKALVILHEICTTQSSFRVSPFYTANEQKGPKYQQKNSQQEQRIYRHHRLTGTLYFVITEYSCLKYQKLKTMYMLLPFLYMSSIRIQRKYVDRMTVKYVVRPEPAPKVWIAKTGFHLSTLASLFLMADVTDKKAM